MSTRELNLQTPRNYSSTLICHIFINTYKICVLRLNYMKCTSHVDYWIQAHSCSLRSLVIPILTVQQANFLMFQSPSKPPSHQLLRRPWWPPQRHLTRPQWHPQFCTTPGYWGLVVLGWRANQTYGWQTKKERSEDELSPSLPVGRDAIIDHEVMKFLSYLTGDFLKHWKSDKFSIIQ